jgi:hypothetical protein
MTFKQFTGYMENMEKIAKMEQGEKPETQTAPIAPLKTMMRQRGIKIPRGR